MNSNFEKTEAAFQQAMATRDLSKLQSLMEEWQALGGSVNASFMRESFRRSIDNHDAEVAKILVRGGCCVEADTMKSILKYTSENDDLSLLQAVLDGGFDVNTYLSGHLGDALLMALLYRKESVIELLLSYGADPNRNRRMGSETALEVAVRVTSPSVVKLLLQHGAEWKNRAALHYAAMDNRVDVAEVLLNHGQDINAIPDDEEIPASYYDRGWGTALHEAARKGHEQMTRFLLERGIDATLKDNNEKTAREVAVDNLHENISHILSTQ